MALHIFLLFCFLARAQDRVCFLDGTCKNGKVLEIGIEEITVNTSDGPTTFLKRDVLLIEYKNGLIEKYNEPYSDVVYDPNSGSPAALEQSDTKDALFQYNQASLNTLALCNSDLSGFFERVLPGKQFGVGGMAAYNFNTEASFMNIHISILSNARKNYDLGIFCNYYLNKLSEKNTFYFGLLFKYTNLSYTSVTNDSSKVGNVYVTNISFTPAKGSQLATIFTFGTHTMIKNNFFIKTLIGIGGFNLHGNYKQQYNQQYNSNAKAQDRVTRSFLLKMYFGINAGFTF